MKYDKEQLNKDLSLIVATLGNRVSYGFYTVGLYRDEKLRISIIDPYVDEPIFNVNGKAFNKDDIVSGSFYFEWILKKAIECEEQKCLDRVN